MDDITDLNNTDIEILTLLAAGRETRGSLASTIETHGNYVGERLKWLRAYDLVTYHHKETGLYVLTEQGRELAEELDGGDDK